MPPRPKAGTFFLLLVVAVALSLSSQSGYTDDADIKPTVTLVGGLRAPEDIDVFAAADSLVISGYSVAGNGDLRVFHPGSGKIDLVYAPSVQDRHNRNEAWGATDCPGPPSGFAPHGIHVSQNPSGTHTLLAVNHTSREAVEWFELEGTAKAVTAKWRGCVIVDEPYWINDVVMLPEGGFIASHMMPRELAHEAFARQPNDGVKSGYVIEWQQASGWSKVAGTEGALPNGIQVSRDGSVVYSNHYLGNQVVAVERASGLLMWEAAVEGAPDNLSMAADGSLLAVTHLESIATIGDCLTRPDEVCSVGFVVYRLNPLTGVVSEILRAGDQSFGGATVAVEFGDSIYFGTATGTSMGKIPK